MNKERNYFIDLLKFIFSIIIVIYHSWIFTGGFGNGYFNRGYLAVEFYFIVTGYLFIKSIETKKEEGNIGLLNLKNIRNKIKPLIPSILFALLLGLIINVICKNIRIGYLVSNSFISELFLFSFFNDPILINVSIWYIMVILLILFILYPIAKKYHKTFNYYIVPLLLIITISIIKYLNIEIFNPQGYKYVLINGFYRGIIGISLGVITYEISELLKRLNPVKIIKVLLTLLEISMYLVLIINMQYELIDTYLTYILYVSSISLTFSKISNTKFINLSIFEKIGKLGFMMYLTNIPIRTLLLNKYINHSYNEILLVYIIGVIIASIICYILSEVILKSKKYLELKSKIKKLFIKSSKNDIL